MSDPARPIDGSPPGSPVPGILQERTLEWVAISFSNVWKWKVKVKSLSRVQLFATPGTAAYQAPLSLGFSRQEYWCGLPFPSPGDLPDPGIEPGSPTLEADALTSEPPGKLCYIYKTSPNYPEALPHLSIDSQTDFSRSPPPNCPTPSRPIKSKGCEVTYFQKVN